MGIILKVNTEQVRKDAEKELRESHRANEGKSVEYLLEDDTIPDFNDGKDVFGIVYLLELQNREGRKFVKIGVTERSIKERMSEILMSFFNQYRYSPQCYPKRFTRTERPYQIEKFLKDHFADRQVKVEKKFSGSTEIFDVPLDEVVELYDKLIKEQKNKK